MEFACQNNAVAEYSLKYDVRFYCDFLFGNVDFFNETLLRSLVLFLFFAMSTALLYTS